jgi:hypothetical protein
MEPYPDILVSRQGCPNLDLGLISLYNFTRRTNEDLYPLLQKYRAKELFDKILPNTTKRDVFVFSVSLYGYFMEEHIAIKVLDHGMNDDWDKTQPDISSKNILYAIESGYPLYFKCSKLFDQPISVAYENDKETFFLSYWHKPTKANYWHFQLFTYDKDGHHLPRESEPGQKESRPIERRLKTIAIKVLEYLITKAICHKHEAKTFTLAGFKS